MTPTITTSPLTVPRTLSAHTVHSVPVQYTQCMCILAYMYTGLSVYFSVSKSVSFDTYFVSTLSVHSVAITDIAAIVYTVGSVMQHMYSVYDIVF